MTNAGHTGLMIRARIEKASTRYHANDNISAFMEPGEMEALLEGARDEVCALYNAIVRDARHSNVRTLVFEEIRERKFCNCTKGHVDLSKVNPGLRMTFPKQEGVKAILAGRQTPELIMVTPMQPFPADWRHQSFQ